jgi:hypothetical protein
MLFNMVVLAGRVAVFGGAVFLGVTHSTEVRGMRTFSTMKSARGLRLLIRAGECADLYERRKKKSDLGYHGV